MAVEQTVQMLAPFVQIVDVRNHFSGLFRVPRGGIHNASKVKVDIKRCIEDIDAKQSYDDQNDGGSCVCITLLCQENQP